MEEVQIVIKIRPKRIEEFDKQELISDIKWQFTDITGYEIYEIHVNQ